MAFCIKRKESVAKAARRLGRKRMEKALRCLSDCGHAEAVHGARQEIKKGRAVLRLIRDTIPKKAYGGATGLLREAANHLAGTRDAYVRKKALQDLTSHFKGQLATAGLRHIREALRDASEQETKRFARPKTTRIIERTLKQAAREFDRLSVSSKGWKALCPGVKAAYARGRHAYKLVLMDASPENFHQWRKRAKDLWYQVRLLRPIWPEQMEALASELKALGEYLGDDHDLVVLGQALEDLCQGSGNLRESETLHGLITQRQEELRAAALALGARFYAEKPSVFCNRLAGYWQIWRKEKKTPVPE